MLLTYVNLKLIVLDLFGPFANFDIFIDKQCLQSEL